MKLKLLLLFLMLISICPFGSSYLQIPLEKVNSRNRTGTNNNIISTLKAESEYQNNF